MLALGSYTFPVMMIPPALASKPPHCTRAFIPSHKCSALNEMEKVSPLFMSMSIMTISPEKFSGSFAAIVSNVWVIVDS